MVIKITKRQFTLNRNIDQYPITEETTDRMKTYDGGLQMIVECAEQGELNRVKHFLERGSYQLLETTDSKGRTPLIAACENQQWKVAKYLANLPTIKECVSKRDESGRNAIDWIYEKCNEPSCVEVLKIVENLYKN